MNTMTKRKKRILFSSIAAFLVLVAMIALPMVFRDKEHTFSSTWSNTIKVENGMVSGLTAESSSLPSTLSEFDVTQSGNYGLSLQYLPQGYSLEKLEKQPEAGPGFLTGIVIKESSGNLVYATCGRVLTFDTYLELETGRYQMQFIYLTKEADYLSFASEYLCGSAMAPLYLEAAQISTLPQSGSWTMEYSFRLAKQSPISFNFISVLLGLLLGIFLVIIILSSITNGELKERYDERQELERGRGFRYAYFTLLIYIFGIVSIDMSGLSTPVDTSVLYMTGAIISIAIYVIYCIWHESYFALNQRMSSLMIAFALIGIANLMIALTSYLDGTLIQNGHLTYHVANLLCALLFLVLFGAMFFKKLSSRRETEGEEDDEA